MGCDSLHCLNSPAVKTPQILMFMYMLVFMKQLRQKDEHESNNESSSDTPTQYITPLLSFIKDRCRLLLIICHSQILWMIF